MGATDNFFVPLFDNELLKILNKDFGRIKKIAWLGAQSENVVGPRSFKRMWELAKHNYEIAVNSREVHASFESLQVDYYDIDTSKGAKYWDINESWNDIEGYDLVIAWRVSPYCRSAKHFCEQVSQLVNKNKLVLFDFFMGHRTLIISQLPKFIRDYLSDYIGQRIERFSCIYSWYDVIKGQKLYPDYHLLPWFKDQFEDHHTRIEHELGYDIRKAVFLSYEQDVLVTEEMLNKHGVSIPHMNILDLYEVYSVRFDDLGTFKNTWGEIYGGEVGATLKKYLNVYFLHAPDDPNGVVSEKSSWFFPSSPYTTDRSSQLPYKQAHMIVQFGKIDG